MTNLNEEHIINQNLKELGQEETTKSFFEKVNEVYEKYLNTLNNETLKYLNMEDERVGAKELYIKTNETTLDINNDPFLKVGQCERKTYFKIFGYNGDNRKFREVEEIERNELVKQQWIKKLTLAGVVCEVEQPPVKVIGGILIKSTIDCFIYNFERKNAVGLLIKPVNNNAQIIRRQLWNNDDSVLPNILTTNLAEILTLLVFYKMPIKVLYVGKTDPTMFREFTCTIKDKCLVVNGIKQEGIRTESIARSLGKLKKSLISKEAPAREYAKPKILTALEIGGLVKEKIIDKSKGDRLIKGDFYEPYECSICKYKYWCEKVGNELPETVF